MSTGPAVETRASWLPLAVVMLAQVQLAFNAWNVSITGITEDLGISPTTVGLANTASTFAVSAFLLLGAKITAKIGPVLAFRIGVIIPALAALLIATAQDGSVLFIAQSITGASNAITLPALTIIIAASFKGKQQASAIGYFAASIPLAQVVSLLIAGQFASTIGWRWSFVLVASIGLLNFALSFLLKPVPPQKNLIVDWTGGVLAATSIILISFGMSVMNDWGLVTATSNAPIALGDFSIVPFFFVTAVIFAQLFLSRTRKRMAEQKVPLVNLDIVRNPSERATITVMGLMLFVGTAVSFLMPLYMQVVQGFVGIQVSFAVIPYTISIFIANTLVSRLYGRFAPRSIASVSMTVVALALLWLSFTIANDWGQISVVIGLVVLGLAQGCVVALVFNSLLTSAPAENAGDVGAIRGLTHNLSGSAGIAVASAFAVGLLTSSAYAAANDSEVFTPEIVEQVNFDNVNFFTNAQLETVLTENTDATEEEISYAVESFTQSRLDALRTTMLVLGGLAALAIIPARRMPGFQKEDLYVGYPKSDEKKA
ncbi:MAG: MFS transporter [Microbacteriaceae bacterium]|nr:MFS transporter [Microbacteriaceae bacterium]